MIEESKRTLVVGDIHGCFEELCRLLDRAALGTDDEIVALGDILDRGPAPDAVLEFFSTRRHVRSLMGNHEEEHVRCFRSGARLDLAQRITQRQLGEERYAHACAFMSSLDCYLDLPEALLIHGFYEPGLPIWKQKAEVLIGTTTGEHYLRTKYRQPWYELYDGKKPIIVGHRNHLGNGQPFVYKDTVFCIDTGCYWGDRLTGLVLPEFHFVSVKARQDHWKNLKLDNMDICMNSIFQHQIDWSLMDAALLDAAAEGHAPLRSMAVREDLRRLADDAAALLNRLLDCVLSENDRLLSHLRSTHQYDLLPPEEQAITYDEHIDNTRLSHFLHIARRGYMTREYLRSYFDGPHALREFMAGID